MQNMCVTDHEEYFLKSHFSANEMIWSHITKITLYDPLWTCRKVNKWKGHLAVMLGGIESYEI